MPSQIGRALQQLEQRAIRALERGIVEEADAIILEAKRIVPYDTGLLQSTGRISAPRTTARSIEVGMGFGGRSGVDYAIEQHEVLEYRHLPGRQAKYLEQPVIQAAGQLGQRLAFRVRQALAG